MSNIIEIDGEPKAWFEDKQGNKYTYIVVGLQADTPAELFQAYANWKDHINANYSQTDILVWRRRPTLDREFPTSGPYKLTCRFVLLPKNKDLPILPLKKEGDPVEFLQ